MTEENCKGCKYQLIREGGLVLYVQTPTNWHMHESFSTLYESKKYSDCP